MRLRDLIDSDRSFVSPKEIGKVIFRDHPNDVAASRNFTGLLIFQSVKQMTWLAVTRSALYCVVDRISETAPGTRWRIPRREIISDNGILLQIRTEPQSDTTAYVYVGEQRRRIYSTRLFADMPIEQRIKHLIKSAMLR